MLDGDALGHVVDLGCGVGRLLPVLAGRAARVTGVDLAPGMLERARLRAAGLSNVDLVVGGAADVPLPSGSVDVVVCFGVFEHLAAGYRDRALAEVARLLRPGAQLLLELNNADSFLLAHADRDNPHRVGAQLDNGYFCELVTVAAVVEHARHLGLGVAAQTANPFYSAVRHAMSVAALTPEEYDEPLRHAGALDRVLGGSPAVGRLADQLILRLVKQ
jgi:SAM-dependent methyltransferase